MDNSKAKQKFGEEILGPCKEPILGSALGTGVKVNWNGRGLE